MKVNKAKLYNLLNEDVLECGIKTGSEMAHFFFQHYVSISKCGGIENYRFLKESDAYTRIERTFDVESKIDWLVEERSDLIDDVKIESYNLQ